MDADAIPELDVPAGSSADRALDELEALFERAPVPLSCIAADGMVLRANQAELDLLGYARDEYVGHPVGQFHADPVALGELLGRIAAGDTFRGLAARLRARDGSIKDVLLDGGAVRERGRVRYARCFTRDVTLQRGAAAAARWAQQRFELASWASRDLIWDWDLRAGRVVWAGDTRSVFGRTPEEIDLLPERDHALWAARVHPDDLAMAEAAARAALASGARFWEHEYRLRRADGSWGWMIERASIVRDEQDRPIRVVGAMEDVTRRRDTEEATTRLAAIIGSSADAIVGKTLDGIVTSWNAAAERIFGYTEAEMVGRSILTLIPPELQAAERELLERIRQGGTVEFAETERVAKDGRRISIALSVSPIRDAHGVVVGASSIKREITERKLAQEELARREERYRALVTATSSIIWITDPAGNFVEPQASWEEYTGQAWEEYRDFGWAGAVHPDDRDPVLAVWSRARADGTVFETEGRLWSRAHQAYRHVVARSAPVRNAAGAVREWIGTVTDVEERWLVEERLRHVEKMESVGRLAGGIAHETNNQMTVVLGTVTFLLREVRSGDARRDLEQIRRAAESTAAITQQLLAFSRRQMLQSQVLDLNAAVTALAPILRRALGESCHLTLALAPDLGRIMADPGQLDQVLLNLALNARDAMPAGGELRIETSNVFVDDAGAAGRSTETVTPGAYARLSMTDSGQGMDPETLSHIFEPFFTTKAVGQGTGLGLSTVYGILKQSGGFVRARSEPGRGATFEVYLPLAPSESGASSTEPAGPGRGDGEVVLVVEDEPTVRSVIARALREYGYRVLEAGSGVEALEVASRQPAPAQLVIADVVMPGMNGGQLAARLRERWPGTPVLFTSGYTGSDAVSRGLLEQGREFIQKPLDPDDLARRVREILDAAG